MLKKGFSSFNWWEKDDKKLNLIRSLVIIDQKKMAKTIYKLTFGIVGIFVVLHPVLVHSDPLFFKNSGTAGGKRPKFFWDIFGVFGSKEEISPSSSYGPPSSYKNPTYIVQQPSTYNPPKPFYGPPSSAKPSGRTFFFKVWNLLLTNGNLFLGTIVTNKPSYKPQSFPSSYLPPKPSYTIPSSTGQKRPSYNPSSSQGLILYVFKNRTIFLNVLLDFHTKSEEDSFFSIIKYQMKTSKFIMILSKSVFKLVNFASETWKLN